MKGIIVVGIIAFIIIILSNNRRTVKSIGSCMILEKKYCQPAKSEVNGNTTITSYKLPSGVPIYSPFEGVVATGIPPVKSVNSKIHYIGQVFYLRISESVNEKDLTKGNRRSVLIMYTGIEERGIKKGSLVKEGQVLARTGATNIDTQKRFMEYNLVTVFTDKRVKIREQL